MTGNKDLGLTEVSQCVGLIERDGVCVWPLRNIDKLEKSLVFAQKRPPKPGCCERCRHQRSASYFRPKD